MYLGPTNKYFMYLPDKETVSAKVHEAWMQSKRNKGIESRKSETGEELMVPYEQLSEDAKDLDRSSVTAVYNAIESLYWEGVDKRLSEAGDHNYIK